MGEGTNHLRSLELFAGGGGMALGLHKAGFGHVALVEFEPKACDTLRRNAERWERREAPDAPWTPDQVVEDDVRNYLGSADLASAVGDGVDLIAGGPPCQPFSLGGVHAGTSDARNMFPAALDFVRELMPRLVLFENVPGLLRPNFLPYFEYVEDQLRFPTCAPRQGDTWPEHHARLRSRRSGPLHTRYYVTRQVINAADLGVPQVRKRVFLMAVRADVADTPVPYVQGEHSEQALLYSQWVESVYWESHGMPAPPRPDGMRDEDVHQMKLDGVPGRHRWLTVRDAIDGLPEPVDGQETPGVLNHVGIPGARSYPGHTGSAIDWPAKTLKAGVHGVCGGEAMIRFSDGSLRYLTVRESARIQTFPDDYEFVGARSHAMRHIGNAVAVQAAQVVGEHMRQHAGL